uniref:Uncharacterized protein n=1 Tax=Mustela putorius furo TaxID=9669 RepID=M3YDF3_MUSPF
MPGEPGSHPRSGLTPMGTWENTLGISRPSSGTRETAQDETGKPGEGNRRPAPVQAQLPQQGDARAFPSAGRGQSWSRMAAAAQHSNSLQNAATACT